MQYFFVGLEYSWIFASSQFRTKGVGMRSMWIYVSSWESSDPNTWTPMLNKSGNFLLFPKLWSDIFPANILPSNSSYYHIIPIFSLFVMLLHFYDYQNWERDATLLFFCLLFCLFLNDLYFYNNLDSSRLLTNEVTLTCHWFELICLPLITHLIGVKNLSFKKIRLL